MHQSSTKQSDDTREMKRAVYIKRSELRSCLRVEVDVLGSPSLIVRTVSVNVKQH